MRERGESGDMEKGRRGEMKGGGRAEGAFEIREPTGKCGYILTSWLLPSQN